MVTIEFINSSENISDNMTKNQQSSNYHNAQVNLVYTIKEMNESMDVKVPLPIKVRVENIGAIWLANNSGVSEQTKHVDTRAHF